MKIGKRQKPSSKAADQKAEICIEAPNFADFDFRPDLSTTKWCILVILVSLICGEFLACHRADEPSKPVATDDNARLVKPVNRAEEPSEPVATGVYQGDGISPVSEPAEAKPQVPLIHRSWVNRDNTLAMVFYEDAMAAADLNQHGFSSPPIGPIRGYVAIYGPCSWNVAGGMPNTLICLIQLQTPCLYNLNDKTVTVGIYDQQRQSWKVSSYKFEASESGAELNSDEMSWRTLLPNQLAVDAHRGYLNIELIPIH